MTNFKEFTIDADPAEMDRADLEATVERFEEANEANADAFQATVEQYDELNEKFEERETLLRDVVADFAADIVEGSVLFSDTDEVFERFDVAEIPVKARELTDAGADADADADGAESDAEFTGPTGDNESEAAEPTVGVDDFDAEARSLVADMEGVVVTSEDD